MTLSRYRVKNRDVLTYRKRVTPINTWSISRKSPISILVHKIDSLTDILLPLGEFKI